jgi:hypothetical protein
MLESGFIDQESLSDIFNSCAVESDVGLVISKNGFAEFAEKLDSVSDVGIHRIRESQIDDRLSIDIGNMHFANPRDSVNVNDLKRYVYVKHRNVHVRVVKL